MSDIHGQSMDPNIWGPCIWSILFYISVNIDLKENMQALLKLYSDIQRLLPCSHCRRHYSTYVLQIPPTKNIKTSNPTSAVEWLWTIHDMVNQNLGKYCVDYEKVIRRTKFMTCTVSDSDITDMIILVWYAGKNKEKTVLALKNMMSLLKSIHEFHVCRVFDDICKDVNVWNTSIMLQLMNRVCLHHGFKQESLDELEARIRHAIAV